MLDQFLSFDKLIGQKLIKFLYYLGLVGIGLATIGAIFSAFGLMGYSFFNGIGAILVALIGAFVGVLFWRFICEIYLLFFRISEDLRDIKVDKLGK